ncbi:MAG TPA: PepSY domain-containing protein [Nitrospira sp.]|nr:PepSY domain-containing protein [Nitrospira sp.]
MRKIILAAVMVTLVSSPAWALFETNKDLVNTAKISLEEAVKNALKLVPGKAVEAEIGTESGRTVYEIEIIDQNHKSQNVLVDAQTGQARAEK